MSNEYEIINRDCIESTWNGAPLLLDPGQSVHLSQTPAGPLIFVYLIASEKDQATLMLVSEGGVPTPITVQPGSSLPSIYIHSFEGTALHVTNVSPIPSAKVWIAAFGVMPGAEFAEMPWDKQIEFPMGHGARSTPVPGMQQVVAQATSSKLTLFAVIGGESAGEKQEARVFALNAPENLGYGTEKEAPPGYYSTTTAENCSYELFVVPGGDAMRPLYLKNISLKEATAKVFLRRL